MKLIEAIDLLRRIKVGHCLTKSTSDEGIKFELHANGNHLVGTVLLSGSSDPVDSWAMAQNQELLTVNF